MQFCFKKINIEAPFPTTQCGHSCQTNLIYEFKDHLYGRALGLKNDQTWIIHLSLDVLAFDLEHRNILQDKLRAFYMDDNLHLITSATHTHYANSIRNDEYLDWLMDRLYEGITEMEYEEKGNISSTYQRKHTNACGKSRISGYEKDNENLCLIRLFDENKINFFNIIINNCHPTTLDAMSPFFSAEYPGYVLKLLEENNDQCGYTFIQGAAGDISSRFVRDGQEYKDMVKLANNLFIEIKQMYDDSLTTTQVKLDYKETLFPYEHDFSPIDTSKIRANLSPRELETIETGQQMRANMENPNPHSIFNNLPKEIIIATLDIGSVKIIFYPNEIFSAYMDNLDLDKSMLVSYSNGYGPYILPVDFPYVTYEMFIDTLSRDTKIRLNEVLKTFNNSDQ